MASRVDLSELCRKANLAVSGTKEELLQRLVGSDAFMAAVKNLKPRKKKAKAPAHVTPPGKKKATSVDKTIAKGLGKGVVVKQPQERKKSEYRVFCDAHRAAVVASGITRPADVMKKLAEMWGKGAKAKAEKTVNEIFTSQAMLPDEVLRAANLELVASSGSQFLYRKAAVAVQQVAGSSSSLPPRVFAWKCMKCQTNLRVKLNDTDPHKPIAFKTTCPSCSHTMHMTAPPSA